MFRLNRIIIYQFYKKYSFKEKILIKNQKI